MQKQFIRIIIFSFLVINCLIVSAQLKWVNVDSLYQPLPASVHVFKTTDLLDGKPNIAYYIIAGLKDRNILFDTDTTYNRRFTPDQFYKKNNQPLIVVNTTFFSFQTNQNLNLVIKKGKLVSYNIHSIPGRRKDTLTYRHPLGSAIGISKKGTADIAWLFTDSAKRFAFAMQYPMMPLKDSFNNLSFDKPFKDNKIISGHSGISQNIFKKWKMKTAVGGGPVLLQNGEIKITNNEEIKFTGNAINDKHPRTAMGYTQDNKLLILVVQGRFPGMAEGASLLQQAKILQELGCWEAINLDGGGSSCLLVNGKETIKPSDATGQRAVPGVFIIRKK